jgi:hypothetical protein
MEGERSIGSKQMSLWAPSCEVPSMPRYVRQSPSHTVISPITCTLDTHGKLFGICLFSRLATTTTYLSATEALCGARPVIRRHGAVVHSGTLGANLPCSACGTSTTSTLWTGHTGDYPILGDSQFDLAVTTSSSNRFTHPSSHISCIYTLVITAGCQTNALHCTTTWLLQ